MIHCIGSQTVLLFVCNNLLLPIKFKFITYALQ